MFTTIIVQPIFNLLVLIAALVPGHNFGLSIIIFTILIRLLLWPLVKKQLHHAKAMRTLQPELKKIKQAAAGDRQKESRMVMELYKEREINPFSSIGILIVQLPILIGLYIGLKKVITDPHTIVNFSYPVLHHLGWIQSLSQNIHQFDNTLFGVIDLTRKATGHSGFYVPALLLAIGSAVGQYLVSKQLLPKEENSRSLKKILSEAGGGKAADQQEVSAAVGRATLFVIPIFVFLASLNFAAALPLYWLTSSVVAYIQQARILNEDVEEAEELADKPAKRAAPKPALPAAGQLKSSSGGLKVTRTTLRDQKSKSASRKRKRRK